MPGPVKPVIPDRPGKVVHALKLLQGVFIVYVVFLAIFVKWLKPGFLSLFSSILLGMGLGIGYSFLHHFYRKRQADLSALVSRQLCNRIMRLLRLPTPLVLKDRACQDIFAPMADQNIAFCLHMLLQVLRTLCMRLQLNLVPGRKGLRNALGDVPSWVAFQEKEKVEVSLRSPTRQ